MLGLRKYAANNSLDHWARRLFALSFFIVGLATCFAYGAWNMPLEWDHQHYLYISERVASGVPPHISQFDPKHGLSMLLSGAAIRLGRAFGADDVRAARALSLLVTAGSIALAWLVVVELTRSLLAAHISVLCMLSFAGFMQIGTMGARPKTFLVLFIFLSMISVARERPFLAGLFSSCCFLCWQPGIIMLGGALLGFLVRPGRKRAIARLAAGAILPYLIYEGYFIYHGALGEQLKQSYWFPAKFLTGRFNSLPDSVERLRSRWDRGFGSLNVLPLLFGLATLLGWAIAAVRPGKTWRFLKQRPAWIQACLCSHAAAAFTLYDQQGYADLLLVLPFVAMSCGMLVGLPGMKARSALLRTGRLLLGTICVGALVVLATHGAQRFDYRVSLDDQYALGKEVQHLLQSGRTIYAVGCTHLLAFAHADNHINVGFFFRGVFEYLAYSGTEGRTFRPLKDGKMPDLVLWSRGRLLGENHWLRREYDLYRQRYEPQDISVWVWKRSALERSEADSLLQRLESMYGGGSQGAAALPRFP